MNWKRRTKILKRKRIRFVINKKKCCIVVFITNFPLKIQLEKDVDSGKRQIKMKDDELENLEERYREKAKLLEEAEERLDEALR